MKTKFGPSQFLKQNTPPIMQKLGNVGLICSMVSLFIIGLPMMMAEAGIQDFAVPATLLKVAKIAAAIGVFTKFITKMWGTIENAKS